MAALWLTMLGVPTTRKGRGPQEGSAMEGGPQEDLGMLHHKLGTQAESSVPSKALAPSVGFLCHPGVWP